MVKRRKLADKVPQKDPIYATIIDHLQIALALAQSRRRKLLAHLISMSLLQANEEKNSPAETMRGHNQTTT